MLPFFSEMSPGDLELVVFDFGDVWASPNNDVVNSATVTASPALTIGDVTVTEKVVAVWVSEAVAGQAYVLGCNS